MKIPTDGTVQELQATYGCKLQAVPTKSEDPIKEFQKEANAGGLVIANSHALAK
jgi:hypothetical protein